MRAYAGAAPASVLVVAAVVRAIAMVLSRGSVIDMDGTEYVRVAQNVAAGHGPIGMRGVPMLIFPPLFSWLIAGFIRLGIDAQTAALGIVFVAGVAFAGVLYTLGTTLYGSRAGLYAGLIAAVLPACVSTSTTIIAEAPFSVCAAAGVLALLHAVRRPSLRIAALCGSVFGIAYLFRPEGLLFAATAFAIVLVTTIARRRHVGAAVVLAACAAVATIPALINTYEATGRATLEGKSSINFHLGAGLRTGAPYLAVADAVDGAGHPVGPEIDPRFYSARQPPPRVPAGEALGLIAGAAIRHVRDVVAAFASREYGFGLLALAAAAGLAAGPWSRSRFGDELVLIAYVVAAYVALAGVWHFWPRYAAIFLPAAICWAARGVAVFGRFRVRMLPDAGLVLLSVLLLGSLAVDVADARENGPALERVAGAWIGAHRRDAFVMDVGSQAAFYAGGTWWPMPYGDEGAAARFITSLHPAYVIVDSSRANDFPPLRHWFERGIPPAFAERANAVSSGGRTMTIYRWRGTPPGVARR